MSDGKEVDKVHEAATPILAQNFEGGYVRGFEGKLPAINMDMPEGYTRGTHLKMMVEVRVRNVRFDENRKGELTRMHVLALEEIQLVGAYSPDEVDPGVGGNASAHADDHDHDEEDHDHGDEDLPHASGAF